MSRRFFLIFFSLAALCSGFVIFETKRFEEDTVKIYSSNLLQKEISQPVTLLFAGDIMLDRGVEMVVESYGRRDWRFPFLRISDVLQDSDILFGNLEGPISDKGAKAGSIYSFQMDPKVIEGLTYAGFDVLSAANNHIFDYGRIAMEDTFLRLKAAGISYIGAGFSAKEARSGVIKEIKGVKIAYLAYNSPDLSAKNWAAQENQSGIALLDEKITEDIKSAKEKADVVIVSMHFGQEYQPRPSEEQKQFSRLAIDAGADLVVGHHSHTAQPVEQYKSGYIAYSLGNFVFDQGFSQDTMKGLLLKVLIKNNKIREVIPMEIQINNFFQPELKEG